MLSLWPTANTCYDHWTVQPSKYINTLFVPKGGAIPVDFQSLSTQGIFDVVRINNNSFSLSLSAAHIISWAIISYLMEFRIILFF